MGGQFFFTISAHKWRNIGFQNSHSRRKSYIEHNQPCNFPSLRRHWDCVRIPGPGCWAWCSWPWHSPFPILRRLHSCWCWRHSLRRSCEKSCPCICKTSRQSSGTSIASHQRRYRWDPDDNLELAFLPGKQPLFGRIQRPWLFQSCWLAHLCTMPRKTHPRSPSSGRWPSWLVRLIGTSPPPSSESSASRKTGPFRRMGRTLRWRPCPRRPTGRTLTNIQWSLYLLKSLTCPQIPTEILF